MNMSYDHKNIEQKWQKKWAEWKLYEAREDAPGEKRYVLDMFPYPSGAGLHVGHPEGYTATDIYSRYLRMKGYNVLHPMGWDAFGLPAENYAIKSGVHPEESTNTNIATFRKQITSIGLSYDWSREISTADPQYYKWTQWFFLFLYNNGLAYKKKANVNWCDSCQTVLANEQVVDGKCERCGNQVVQKDLEQWFFKITDYAERLLEGLDDLDWPHSIKEMQRNWIGKSEGAEITFNVVIASEAKRSEAQRGNPVNINSDEIALSSQTPPRNDTAINVFTTRPDTLFGATYMVLAPEHELVQQLKDEIENWNEVESYINEAAKKSALQRTDLNKEKTGVELQGVKATNPANHEAIPIWIADYVLASYGTGAIMAVPAHDERDFEFAKKYNLPVRKVIQWDDEFHSVVIKKSVTDNFAKEIKEQGWYCDDFQDWGYAVVGNKANQEKYIDIVQKNLLAGSWYVHTDGSLRIVIFKDKVFSWETENEAAKTYARSIAIPEEQLDWDTVENYPFCYTDKGVLVNSGEFDGMDSEEAKKKITKKVGGTIKTQYKLRDWLVSRQRYWGAPIPIVYDPDGNAHPVKDEHLPLELPHDVDYKPKGTSPLGSSEEWKKKAEKLYGEGWRFEIDTMDTFVCSSWYYFRFADPHNKNEFASKEKIEEWLPVDLYVGGAEHAVLHLLYARFFTKALKDHGYVTFDEPFQTLRNQGMILAEDGRKMSKSLGNVINPDQVIEDLGADSLRLYEMFMGPLEDTKPWQTRGIVGVRRFLERVWALHEQLATETKTGGQAVTPLLHKTIKKVTEDIESLRFNTAIAAMMIFANEAKENGITADQFGTFVTILAPFAPHIAEELWQKLGHTDSIFKQSWPTYDESLLAEDEVTIAVQVNGKVRNTITLAAAADEATAKEAALASEQVQKWIGGKKVVKCIYVPGKIVNIVVK